MQRYLQDVVATQPDGRILLFWSRLNIVAGLLLMAMMWTHPFFPKAAPGHVLLFVGMPLVGLAWLMRTRPPLPATRRLGSDGRQIGHSARRGQRDAEGAGASAGPTEQGRAGLKGDLALQALVGLFPWWALLASHLTQA